MRSGENGRPASPDDVALAPKYDLTPVQEESKKPTVRRPYKFTPQAKRKIVVALQMGHFPATAARHGGVDKDTLLEWWYRGKLAGPESEGVENELHEFMEECQQARARGKMGLVAILWGHAREDGKVALKLLEKLFPEEYGPKTTHEIKGKVDHVHKTTDYSKFTDEELEQAEQLALKARRERLKDEAIDAEIIE